MSLRPPPPPGKPAPAPTAAAQSGDRHDVSCPYCRRPACLTGGTSIYPLRPDLAAKWFYVCWSCDAWVGCHDGTQKPLGRLADHELRRAKMAVHEVFDPLWQAKMERDKCSKHEARGAAYKWLAQQLGISVEDCHVGMFDVATCKRAIEIMDRIPRKAPSHE